MKPFVLFATLFVIVNARPEAGYSYQNPNANRFSGNIGGSLGGSSGFIQGGSSSGLNNLGGGYVNGGYSQSSQFNSFNGGQGGGIQGGTFGGHLGSGQLSQGSGQFSQGSGQFSQGSSGFQSNGFYQGGTQVHKHVYVHVAPEEPEEIRQQAQIQAGVRQKHYKIIFIKAPSYSTQQQIIAQQNALKEEKTLVYVLVKKPDALADINIPAQAQAPINKPEVYFIRYKAQKDGINGISGTSGISGINSGISGINSGISGINSGFSGSGISGGGLSIGSSSSSSGSSFSTGGIISGSTGATKYGPPGYEKK
ncbi:unnamed protein product [Brassicogethes aeneus]|uniref:DUF243 domain-containing protein n=1 Tax=Brassicogethes aeneus TaxID=1431903 RepID=A0A9P0AT99_BRAAE|nr:unnamed protein product [Brassicogethes aeneus]